MLCIGYSGSLATTAPLAAKLLETFHFTLFYSAHNPNTCTNSHYTLVPSLRLCYHIYKNNPMTWEAAKNFCISQSARLLILKDAATENYFIQQHFYGESITNETSYRAFTLPLIFNLETESGHILCSVNILLNMQTF